MKKIIMYIALMILLSVSVIAVDCFNADTNGDGWVDLGDFVVIRANFGRGGLVNSTPCSEANDWCDWADLDRSGNVGNDDFTIFLANWGKSGCDAPPVIVCSSSSDCGASTGATYCAHWDNNLLIHNYTQQVCGNPGTNNSYCYQSDNYTTVNCANGCADGACSAGTIPEDNETVPENNGTNTTGNVTSCTQASDCGVGINRTYCSGGNAIHEIRYAMCYYPGTEQSQCGESGSTAKEVCSNGCSNGVCLEGNGTNPTNNGTSYNSSTRLSTGCVWWYGNNVQVPNALNSDGRGPWGYVNSCTGESGGRCSFRTATGGVIPCDTCSGGVCAGVNATITGGNESGNATVVNRSAEHTLRCAGVDLNGDGAVTDTDIVLFDTYINDGNAAGDINGDGNVSFADLSIIEGCR
jgi:hypothetical protein